jgi:hypothetical protein
LISLRARREISSFRTDAIFDMSCCQAGRASILGRRRRRASSFHPSSLQILSTATVPVETSDHQIATDSHLTLESSGSQLPSAGRT